MYNMKILVMKIRHYFKVKSPSVSVKTGILITGHLYYQNIMQNTTEFLHMSKQIKTTKNGNDD